LIVLEAGGTVTDFEGKDYSIYGDELLASNGLIHDSMMAAIRNRSRP
jgi:myo-inositol-1(or 4)-monophosphatase